MNSTTFSRIAYLAAFSALALSTACSSTDSAATGAGAAGGSDTGAGGATAGAGGTAAAGKGGSSAGAGGSSAGAGGSSAGAGGSSAGAGGSVGGAGGSTGGAGGSTAGAGGTGAGGSTAPDRRIRLANLVVGFSANPIDVCVRSAGGADWATIAPIFKGMGDTGQFASPTVSVWFDVTMASDNLDFRFVNAMASDCGTPLSAKVSDYTATIPSGEYHTLALAGDTGTGGTMKALALYDIKHPSPTVGMSTWTVFNGLVNIGSKGADFGTYDSATKTFSGGIPANFGESKENVSAPGSAVVGVRRADSNLVLAIGSAPVTDVAGGLRSVFATGTNENAATGSNNLPWIVECDDLNVTGQAAHPLVAACDYSQGPQFGVK